MNDKKFEWLDNPEQIGEHLFTFDGGATIYSLFKDYPYALSEDEKALFDAENPYWAEFFKDRSC